jgi:HEPN domain-containing protein
MIKNAKEIIKYWLAGAAHDEETMHALYQSRRYSDALFFAHMVLEKIIKALVVRHTREHAPYMHDLVRLSELSGVPMSEADLDLLDIVNSFNIRARYPDYKLRFYKRCTREYTTGYLKEIRALYQKLCQRAKQNR